MKNSRILLALTPLCALLATGAAHATNGYFAHGAGMKAKGMGGAATALAQDSFGGANNPASMVWAGSRLDVGADWFRPVRDAERSGAVVPGITLNGKVQSDRENFLIPEFGYNKMISNTLALGVSVYGNGGMNTTYPSGTFNCGGGPANILCGSTKLGVDMMQLIVAPTLSVKVNEQHSFGVAALLGYQRFKAYGLQAFDNAPGFPPFTGAPGSVTNNGYDSSTGAGLRIGYMGRLSEKVSVGASYATKMKMGRFDQYKGLFAGAGGFDIPSSYNIGVAVSPVPAWTVALDVGRINYSDATSVNNASMPLAPLGAASGPGFGWRDINVVKLGVAWQMSPTLTLRAGYNRGDNPISPADVTFNILAPGVVKSHYTFGFTHAIDKDNEITGALMVAPRVSVSGASLFNGFMGGAAGNETIGMRQTAVGLAWSRKF